MGRGRPQGQVAEDLLDHCWLLDEGDDAHGTCAAGTHERIHFVDLLDEARPRALRGRARDFGAFLDGCCSPPWALRRFPRLTLLYQP